MNQLIENISYALDDRYLLEMANLQPHETGLVAIVHVSSKGGAKHNARVKVSNIAGTFNEDNFSITIEKTPRVIGKCKLNGVHLKSIIHWVLLNKDHILKVWENGGMMTIKEIDAGFKHL